MGLLDPALPDYDPLEWKAMPFAERARLVCRSWALQGYGSPWPIYIVYAIKVALFVGGWMFFCSRSPTLGGPATLTTWWLEPLAFEKAIIWSMLFEILGLGCGSGPLTGRYMPPVGGFLYFLRRRTAKLSLFRRLPLLGGDRRGVIDVVAYLALIAAALVALGSATIGKPELAAIVAAAALLIVCDRTMFLAARGEHYLVTIAVFALAASEAQLIAGAMAVQSCLWFFAGVSKLNHHFPAVVCVMTSNSPVARIEALRRRMYRSFPEDLRPSRLAVLMAHAGTALELGIPLVLLASPPGSSGVIVGMIGVLLLHGFITSNVPMGVPIEWNVLVVYAAFALFWHHGDVSVLDVGPLIGVGVLAVSVAVPIAGNLWPSKISFLPAMRYYAGNWAMSVWLFRGESYRKLEDNLVMTSPWVDDQLARFYDRSTAVALIGKVVAFRLMHLHGRTLGGLVERALPGDARLADYEWVDGEIVAGLVLGWNFGDGHLHNERLLDLVGPACAFEPGELRCVFVESQPLFGRTLEYRIVDAATGSIESGHFDIEQLRAAQPWDVLTPASD